MFSRDILFHIRYSFVNYGFGEGPHFPRDEMLAFIYSIIPVTLSTSMNSYWEYVEIYILFSDKKNPPLGGCDFFG